MQGRVSFLVVPPWLLLIVAISGAPVEFYKLTHLEKVVILFFPKLRGDIRLLKHGLFNAY